MQTISSEIVQNKKVLLRYDIDVQLTGSVVSEDYKLKAGLDTLRLCLKYAQAVIMIGHLGRPQGQIVPALSVEPIRQWFDAQGFSNPKFTLLENVRFDPREEVCDPAYAGELAAMGDVFVNEAFAAYRPAVSTTVLPTLLPGYAGLRFAKEVEVLIGVRENPKKPFVAIMGGAKVADKLPVIQVLAQKADAVLVGGKLVKEVQNSKFKIQSNVLIGKLTADGFDIAPETTESWRNLITGAAQIIWNGPLGKFEDPKNDQTRKIARMILDSDAEVIIGGGDTVAALHQYGLLEKAQKQAFVSVGGGAMLKLLAEGTLPTIQALF